MILLEAELCAWSSEVAHGVVSTVMFEIQSSPYCIYKYQSYWTPAIPKKTHQDFVAECIVTSSTRVAGALVTYSQNAGTRGCWTNASSIWCTAIYSLVPRPNFFFTGALQTRWKNRVWTLSLRKLGQVYIWRVINWVIVGVNYIISNQQCLLWRQKICKLAIYDDA